jgi:hypothetical protein
MNRFENSVAIAKRSWAVLRTDRGLAWFPVLSAVCSVVAVLVVAGLVAATGVDSKASGDSLRPIGYVFVAAGYLGLALVQTFFLGALVAGADARLAGRPISVREGLAAARSRMHRLLPWAIVSATISVVLNQLERQGVIGRIVAGLIGLAWSLLTFLTVPILMLEDVGVGAALTRSKNLFKQTWGENVFGQFGLGLVGLVLSLPGILVFAVGSALGAVGLVVFGGAALVWLIAVSVAMAAMSGIYRTALYRFATTGRVPAEFEGSDFQNAFRPRPTSGGGSGFGGLGRFGGGLGGSGGGFAGFRDN